MSFGNRKEVRRSNILMMLEAIFISYIGYLSFEVVTQFYGSPPVSLVNLFTIVGLFAFLVVVSALSVGLYETKLRETFRGIIRRIFVSVAL
ncbi:MAG: sugar transferase, partial [Paraglaciecola sp.]|nr:sugar transferase [Paraglaciecola sp.]